MNSSSLVDCRVLVVGSYGMLAQDLIAATEAVGATVTGVDRDSVDITDAAAVAGLIAPGGASGAGGQPFDVVVNCAAWTAVDAAEDEEAAAFAVNAVGPANLARACALVGSRLVHVSTDYVFAGDGDAPYAEDAPIAPRSAYGRTKAAGEWAVRAELPDAHLIVRTAWLYGAGGPCFPKTMARLAAERDVLTVVDDQRGQPTWTADLADLIVRLVVSGAPAGTYHGTSAGEVTWRGFASAVVASAGLSARVDPVSSAAFAAKAARPAYSVLGHDALLAAGVEPIGDWRARWNVAAESVLAG